LQVFAWGQDPTARLPDLVLVASGGQYIDIAILGCAIPWRHSLHGSGGHLIGSGDRVGNLRRAGPTGGSGASEGRTPLFDGLAHHWDTHAIPFTRRTLLHQLEQPSNLHPQNNSPSTRTKRGRNIALSIAAKNTKAIYVCSIGLAVHISPLRAAKEHQHHCVR